MTPEAKVKKKVVEQLKQLRAYYFYPVTGGYGRSGVPDIIGCYEGKRATGMVYGPRRLTQAVSGLRVYGYCPAKTAAVRAAPSMILFIASVIVPRKPRHG
jgi:hypothetical protein